MPRRRSSEEADGEAAAAATAVGDAPQPPRPPPPPADLHQVLQERMPVLRWLSLGAAAHAFRASPTTRALLSALVAVEVDFEVQATASCSPRSVAQRKLRVSRARVRLPRSSANDVVASVVLSLKEVPLKLRSFNQALTRAIPVVLWEDCREMRIRCRDNISTLDRSFYGYIHSLEGLDALPMLLSNEVSSLRSVTKLSFTIPQLVAVPEDFCMPNVRRVKLTCQDIALADTAFQRLGSAFPGLNRLHLFMLPVGLLPLCGLGFQAPRDLRLSLDPHSQANEREANVFVASHLMSLPFSWGDFLLRNVMRLQMAELNENHGGLAIEKLSSVIRALPLLRRLGTVSIKTAKLIDITSDEFRLEELVLVMELEDLNKFFRSFIPLEQQKRRTTLKRLAVHFHASDGVARLSTEIENAICAAWYNIATSMLQPDVVLVFSAASRQLLETAMVQLAFIEPSHFCLDAVEYLDGQTPLSTPMDKELPYFGTDGIEQPSGTLASEAWRPGAGGADAAAAFGAFGATLGGDGDAPSPPHSPAYGASPKLLASGSMAAPLTLGLNHNHFGSSPRVTLSPAPSMASWRRSKVGGFGKTKRSNEWQKLAFADAIETLRRAEDVA